VDVQAQRKHQSTHHEDLQHEVLAHRIAEHEQHLRGQGQRPSKAFKDLFELWHDEDDQQRRDDRRQDADERRIDETGLDLPL
jgi:hypothetical protein